MDGVKHFAVILQDASKYSTEEILVPKKCILIGSEHHDLSPFTKPSIRDFNGVELLQVAESDEHWVLSLKQGRKRSSETVYRGVYFCKVYYLQMTPYRWREFTYRIMAPSSWSWKIAVIRGCHCDFQSYPLPKNTIFLSKECFQKWLKVREQKLPKYRHCLN